MCILCVASRWSRRIVAALPWLMIPLIVLWALSQLLPPRYRFEVTSPRLACLFVILISLGWYEILMPRLSAWRERRIALLRERKRIEALEAAKWRKEAKRRCRNCLTAYRDQNPAGGKFMCTYCGHISRRPVLDISHVVPEGGVISGAGELGNKNLIIWDGKRWPLDWSGKSSWLGELFSGIANCWRDRNSHLLMRCVGSFLICVWRRLSRDGSCGGDGVSNARGRGGSKKGEEGLGNHANRGEKARRKAEEKRQARLEKEMLEEEERKQREEVARLVEERRRLRDEKLEAEKASEREAAAEKERENKVERRRQEKGSSKDKFNDGEDVRKKSGKENERKYESDKKGEMDRRESHKNAAENIRAEVAPRTSDFGMKGGINGSGKVSGARQLDSVKGSSNSPSKSPASHANNGSSFWRKSLGAASNFGIKPGKLVSENSIGSTGLQSNQSNVSAWNRMRTKVWGKENVVASKDVSRQPSSIVDNMGNAAVSGADRNLGITLPRPPVGVELQSAPAATTTMRKSWHQLFSTSSDSSSGPSSADIGDQLGLQHHAETGTMSASLDLNSRRSSPMHSYFTSSSPLTLGLGATTSVFSSSVVVSVSAADSMNSSVQSSPCSVPSVSSVTDETSISEDSSYVPDPVLLLGPVSESLDNFPLDSGGRHPSEKVRSDALSTDQVPIPAPINKPGPIEAPVSKFFPSGIVDDVHCGGEQRPPITKPWGMPTLCASEQGKWQMWDTPQLGLSETSVQLPFKSENHISSVFSQQTTHAIPNQCVDPLSSSNSLWLNWEEHGNHQAPTQEQIGAVYDPVIVANGHSHEQSSNSFWSTSESQDGKAENNWSVETSGPSTWSTTTKPMTRLPIGALYNTPDVQSVWSYN